MAASFAGQPVRLPVTAAATNKTEHATTPSKQKDPATTTSTSGEASIQFFDSEPAAPARLCNSFVAFSNSSGDFNLPALFLMAHKKRGMPMGLRQRGTAPNPSPEELYNEYNSKPSGDATRWISHFAVSVGNLICNSGTLFLVIVIVALFAIFVPWIWNDVSRIENKVDSVVPKFDSDYCFDSDHICLGQCDVSGDCPELGYIDGVSDMVTCSYGVCVYTFTAPGINGKANNDIADMLCRGFVTDEGEAPKECMAVARIPDGDAIVGCEAVFGCSQPEIPLVRSTSKIQQSA